MDSINLGTIELYSVEVSDRLQGITDLSTYVCEFKIISEDETTIVTDWTAVSNINGMRADCLVDTTTTSPAWTEGTYKLYLKITINPEVPILGPFEFEVS